MHTLLWTFWYTEYRTLYLSTFAQGAFLFKCRWSDLNGAGRLNILLYLHQLVIASCAYQILIVIWCIRIWHKLVIASCAHIDVDHSFVCQPYRMQAPPSEQFWLRCCQPRLLTFRVFPISSILTPPNCRVSYQSLSIVVIQNAVFFEWVVVNLINCISLPEMNN